ncbi:MULTISPECIES: RNA polymerase sigma-70 factor [Roseivirga]|jgi:RNA polymerase sigma-70 factor (ECF subfamily)|uniref:DNA-directed RNA polymerase sigma-70 factor n=1 Tax=Roseivirga thermotolerans TaxID=1758176 RepID=A0ABQ3IA64_9BACT|nr:MULTISPECIES: RNA polymerase sigma-70 factor [Roseivirga]MEC7754970.1 RNA polymerase sigma-70 factor [Bacteroidota bacterium]GHE75560.1 DNA-directed RNA polymerase sigma-70 factor [Roseivirga thermotolerans]|tara:strand:+ start:13738 stop:14229 length:492 start_codon:yes stop_codon:yes gene_type:complete
MTLSEFKSLFDQYYTPIKNFLYYKSGNIEQSEDIAQDVFMKLWDKREEVQPETVKSYLYTIANNMLLNKIRHDKVVMNFAERHKTQQEEHSPEFALEEKEFKAELEEVIGAMPEKQREVFLMNRIDELTYKEIADRLALSVKAVEKRMHGALAHLREHIKYKI